MNANNIRKKRKAGVLSSSDEQVQTLFGAHCGLASELEGKRKELDSTNKMMKSATKELKDMTKSFRASEAEKKKKEKELEDKQRQLDETQKELQAYEDHVMLYGGAGAPAASPVVLRPASSINPPDLFVSPPESGLLRKAAPVSSEVFYTLHYRPPSFLPPSY